MTTLDDRDPDRMDHTKPPNVHDVLEAEAAGELISPAEARFERWRKVAGAILAPLAFLLAWWLTAPLVVNPPPVPAATAPAATQVTTPATLTTAPVAALAPADPAARPPIRLSPQAQKLAAILAAVVVLWVTETLPLAVTALLGAVLCASLGVAPIEQVLAPFADKIVFLFIGSFMLARAMSLHRLDRRIALGFLAIPWVGRSPARILAGMGLVTAVLSMWVSNTATTAMMVPIAIGVLTALHRVRVETGQASGPLDARNWPYATGMLLMIAYAASIGGIGTPVGSPPNLIGIGALEKLAGVRISFFRWMAIMVPMLALMCAVLFVLLYALHPDKRRTTRTTVTPGATARAGMSEYLAGERAALGGWTRGQVNTLIAFAVAVSLWMIPGFLAAAYGDKEPILSGFDWTLSDFNRAFPESIVALIAALLLFVLPTRLREGQFTMTWGEAVKIDWGTILLFGGGLTLGALMDKTGLAAAIGQGVDGLTGTSSLWTMTAVAIVLGIVLSETTSNTTAATMLVPVMIASANAAGVSVIPPALGAVLGASYGFMLPVSTPPNAIVYGSGLVPIPRMIRAGVLFDLIGFVIIWVGLRVLCPAMGLAGR